LYTVPIFGVKKVEQGCFENGQSQITLFEKPAFLRRHSPNFFLCRL
jgi:hypothetical protein